MKQPATIAKQLKKAIADLGEGRVFDYTILAGGRSEQAILQALSRAVNKGEIIRMGKGKYYKPRQTRFGMLRPGEDELIRSLTEKNGKVTGYLTGSLLYNKLGLTTQISNQLLIARNGRLPVKNIHGYKIKFAARPFPITKKYIPLLQLLDVLRSIKEIPDSSVDTAIPVIVGHLKKLSIEQWRQLIKLALDYSPATRALLGAITEINFPVADTSLLMKSLNPLTKYPIGVSKKILPNKDRWHIE
ncbi:MAG: DUF6088 family protein [Bacteroidota bacterium]